MSVLILNGSPRGKKSTSSSFGNYLAEQFHTHGVETNTLTIRNQLNSDAKIHVMLKEVENSDLIILLAPLYIDSQPYIVIKLMELIAEKEMNLEGKRFFPIMNNGFPEAEQITAVSIPIYHKFAKMVGLIWAGSLTIGMGEIFQGRRGKQLNELGKNADKMKSVLNSVAETLSTGEDLPDLVPKVMPGIFYWKILKRSFLRMGDKSWSKIAEEKGEQVDAKPYLE